MGSFDDWPIIHTYTPAEAVADGLLVDVSDWNLHIAGIPVVRITTHLYNDLLPFAAAMDPDPARALRGTLKTKCQYARDDDGDGYLLKLPGSRGSDDAPDGFGIWAVGDGDGYVLMWPEDY